MLLRFIRLAYLAGKSVVIHPRKPLEKLPMFCRNSAPVPKSCQDDEPFQGHQHGAAGCQGTLIIAQILQVFPAS